MKNGYYLYLIILVLAFEEVLYKCENYALTVLKRSSNRESKLIIYENLEFKLI